MSVYSGHKDICNLLLSTKGINVNAVDEVSVCDVGSDSVLCCIVQQIKLSSCIYFHTLVHLIVDINFVVNFHLYMANHKVQQNRN